MAMQMLKTRTEMVNTELSALTINAFHHFQFSILNFQFPIAPSTHTKGAFQLMQVSLLA
jgi:hypothetical protein